VAAERGGGLGLVVSRSTGGLPQVAIVGEFRQDKMSHIGPGNLAGGDSRQVRNDAVGAGEGAVAEKAGPDNGPIRLTGLDQGFLAVLSS